MMPVLLESGIILYGILQVLVAFLAVVLAVIWKKYEFLPGLAFLLLYSVVEIIDTVAFTVLNFLYLDVAQFGFILLAIIFFIIGMHPTWSLRLAAGLGQQKDERKPSGKESVFSTLRKI